MGTLKSIEELKSDFACGKEKLRDDEYIGENGLPFCKKCNTERYFYSEKDNVACRVICKCQARGKTKSRSRGKTQKAVRCFPKTINFVLFWVVDILIVCLLPQL